MPRRRIARRLWQVSAARSKGVGDLWLHAVLPLLGSLLLLIGSPTSVLIATGAVACTVYVLLALREGRRSAIKVTPLSFYFMWSAVGLGASAVYIGYLVAIGEMVSFSVREVAPTDLAFGYVVFLFGSFALHLGLYFSRPRESSDSDSKVTGPLVYLPLAIIGCAALYSPASFNAVGIIGRNCSWLALSTACCFALSAQTRRRLPRTLFVLSLAAICAVLFLLNLRSFSKAYLMYSFVPFVWLTLVDRRLRRWLPVTLIALAILYLSVIAPVVTAARETSLGDDPVARLTDAFGGWIRQGSDSSGRLVMYRVQLDQFLRRQFDPAPVGYLQDEIRLFGYQYGATMTYAGYAFVPRFLWPDKPTVTRGAWFSTYTGFSASEETATTSTGITAVGELFWNFGIAGVLIGMAAIGLGIGALWRLAGPDPRERPLAMWLYVMTVMNMPNMPEAVTVIVAFTANYLLFGVVLRASRTWNLSRQTHEQSRAGRHHNRILSDDGRAQLRPNA